MVKQKIVNDKPSWWLERLKEPSTYQGLSVLAGLLGQHFLGSTEAGQSALTVGLSLASLIQVAKKEPLEGRDF